MAGLHQVEATLYRILQKMRPIGEKMKFNNSVQDLDFSSFSSISQEDCFSQAQVKDTLTRPVFSPMKQALIDRIMKEFWIIFNQETEGIQ